MIRRVVQLAIIFIVASSSVCAPFTAMALEEQQGIVDTENMQEDTMQPVKDEFPVDTEVETITLPEQIVSTPQVINETKVSSPALPEEPPLVLPELLINRVMAGKSGQSSYEYIELYNPNLHEVSLASWQLLLLRKDGSDTKQIFSLNGTVKPKSYILFAGTDTDLDAFEPDFRLKTNSIITTGGIVQVTNAKADIIETLRWGDAANPSLQLPTGKILSRVYIDGTPNMSGDSMQDFVSSLSDVLPRFGGYMPQSSPVNRCNDIQISEIAANVTDERQFIELYNSAGDTRSLDGCLLETNRSTTNNFVLTGSMNPGEYRSISISTSDLTLTKTTSGTVYLLSSDGEEEVDARSYDSLAENTSWAWFSDGDTWHQTFAITPDQANVWQEFLPCEIGYERNEDTGRCRKIASSETLAECASGQYRNPETNRCRNIATATNTLTPCLVGQYRNPETNRCRSMATLTNELTPCRVGQERNPDTNRCRNVNVSMPEAAYAVDPVKETGKVFMGWWALGGMGVLAAGYGAWEWRREVLSGIQKVVTFFTSGK